MKCCIVGCGSEAIPSYSWCADHGSMPDAARRPVQPQPMPFDEQVARIVDSMDHADAVIFLAGIRFRDGFNEYGDLLFTKPLEALRRDALEEAADQFTYEAAIDARGGMP